MYRVRVDFFRGFPGNSSLCGVSPDKVYGTSFLRELSIFAFSNNLLYGPVRKLYCSPISIFCNIFYSLIKSILIQISSYFRGPLQMKKGSKKEYYY